MKTLSAEKFIEKLDCEVYPITIVKFLLNKKRILNYFQKAADENFELRGIKYFVDNSNCEICNSKKDQGILCRQHTSIQRVLSGEKVAFDLDTSCFFYKNEIFRQVGEKVVIIYCPHPKLIQDEITDSKVRKVNPITIIDPSFKIPNYNSVRNFLSTELLNNTFVKCWFNNEFSIITIPEDRNYSNFCLIPNK